MTKDEVVQHLQATGQYRILKKLTPGEVAAIALPEFPLQGVILDTETTGLDHRKDEIIKIGATAFTFDVAGNIADVVGVYGGLQQAMNPKPADITRPTGITDEMMAGQMIDIALLQTALVR